MRAGSRNGRSRTPVADQRVRAVRPVTIDIPSAAGAAGACVRRSSNNCRSCPRHQARAHDAPAVQFPMKSYGACGQSANHGVWWPSERLYLARPTGLRTPSALPRRASRRLSLGDAVQSAWALEHAQATSVGPAASAPRARPAVPDRYPLAPAAGAAVRTPRRRRRPSESLKPMPLSATETKTERACSDARLRWRGEQRGWPFLLQGAV
jgi:hypothetical protein